MRARAGAANTVGPILAIHNVNLSAPKKGEFLVKKRATGICRGDEFPLSGAERENRITIIRCHEWASVVLETGD